VRVGDLLTQAVPALAERLLVETICKAWAQIIGPEAARRSRPIALRQSVLEVGVDNSPWLQELTLRGASIASRLQERHGAAVSAVRFVLGTNVAAGRLAAPARSRSDAPSRQLSAEEARQVDDAARRLADHGLAASFTRLLTKDLLARGERRVSAASEPS